MSWIAQRDFCLRVSLDAYVQGVHELNDQTATRRSGNKNKIKVLRKRLRPKQFRFNNLTKFWKWKKNNWGNYLAIWEQVGYVCLISIQIRSERSFFECFWLLSEKILKIHLTTWIYIFSFFYLKNFVLEELETYDVKRFHNKFNLYTLYCSSRPTCFLFELLLLTNRTLLTSFLTK